MFLDSFWLPGLCAHSGGTKGTPSPLRPGQHDGDDGDGDNDDDYDYDEDDDDDDDDVNQIVHLNCDVSHLRLAENPAVSTLTLAVLT